MSTYANSQASPASTVTAPGSVAVKRDRDELSFRDGSADYGGSDSGWLAATDHGAVTADAGAPSDGGLDSAATGASNWNRRHKLRVRRATVYDAVEGRVYNTRDQNLGMFSRPDPFHPYESALQRQRRRSASRSLGALSRRRPLPPDEVLFRRARAPTRWAEHDVYAAHERELGRSARRLPDGDMLGAVHAFASRFYGTLNRRLEAEWRAGGRPDPWPYAMPKDGRATREHVDERSMDETALLAFGILLEEAGRDVLGEKGHLVFTEGVEEDEGGPNEHDEGEGDADEKGDAEEEDRDAADGKKTGWLSSTSPSRKKAKTAARP